MKKATLMVVIVLALCTLSFADNETDIRGYWVTTLNSGMKVMWLFNVNGTYGFFRGNWGNVVWGRYSVSGNTLTIINNEGQSSNFTIETLIKGQSLVLLSPEGTRISFSAMQPGDF